MGRLTPAIYSFSLHHSSAVCSLHSLLHLNFIKRPMKYRPRFTEEKAEDWREICLRSHSNERTRMWVSPVWHKALDAYVIIFLGGVRGCKGKNNATWCRNQERHSCLHEDSLGKVSEGTEWQQGQKELWLHLGPDFQPRIFGGQCLLSKESGWFQVFRNYLESNF